ncbi:MAG: ABC transporter ATP-binding protein [Actinobacteria bacterium]|nr:ABC transporter ATP-binding protein [Actinomycetota bacterium]
MTAIEFNQITKKFGPNFALREFDLKINEGDLVSLVGPSGCGKTTALRIAAGFTAPDEGKVCLNGVDITQLPAHKRNVGMVFQSYSLFPNLTVADNIEFGLKTRKISRSESSQILDEMVHIVKLEGLEARYPHQLSGGQQQRVALARALAIRPALLLLDEPLSALDAKVRLEVRNEIRRLQQSFGITTIFVTHDQEEAMAISDQIAVMSQGKVEQYDAPYEVYMRPATPFVAQFVGTIVELVGVALADNLIDVAGQIFRFPNGSFTSGSTITLTVRPEEFEICDAESELGCIVGRVVRTEFRGAHSIIEVGVAGFESNIFVLAASEDALRSRDSRIHLRLIPGFDRLTTR